MDDETRAAFARINHGFELNQSQYNDLRQDVAGLHLKIHDVSQEVGGIRRELDSLRQEFHRFSDWVAAQFAEIRHTLQQLTVRVNRLH